MFTALFTISEYIVTLAANKWFPAQPYVFSLSVLFITLVLMRWGLFAVIPAVVGAVAFCVASGAGTQHYLIYITGNIFAVLSFLYLKLLGKENVRKDAIRSAILVILVYLLMQIGRWLAGLAVGSDAGTIILFLTTDSLSLLFALIAITVLRRTDGMFEDQKAYLLRIEEENNAHRNI